jgi:pimeloyl-ACP methyl ester carboxylesterase
VILVHGIWDRSDTWNTFTPLLDDPRFFVRAVDYNSSLGIILSATPAYRNSILMTATANALGFSYTEPIVLDKVQREISTFEHSGNSTGIEIAAIQADVVAHSMGGDIARAITVDHDFLNDSTLGQGIFHKLITIDTPYFGTPLAGQLLEDGNSCVRNILARKGNIAFESVTTPLGTFNGAVFDLEGDGSGGSLSTALNSLRQPNVHPVPTTVIAGIMTAQNRASVFSSIAANYIRARCPTDFLAESLTASDWSDVFLGQNSDAIVPLESQMNGLPGPPFSGFVHSDGTETLGFTWPSVLDESRPPQAVHRIPARVIDLLNTPVWSLPAY